MPQPQYKQQLKYQNITLANILPPPIQYKCRHNFKSMNTFNIQLLKTQPPNPPILPTCKPVPKLNLGLESIVCMNYPIEILVQVVTAHFQEDACAANLVVKALKVISISLKDKELKSQIQNIITQNLHKRDKIYTLAVYWASFSTNLLSVLIKLDSKLVDSVIACVFSTYCFTKCNQNSQITKFLSCALTELPIQNSSKVSQLIKNQFLSMHCPLQPLLSCATKFRSKDQKLHHILDDICTSLLKSKQTQHQFGSLLQHYFSDTSVRSEMDAFLQTYPNCIPAFISNLQQVLEVGSVLPVWLACRQGSYKMQFAIKAAIKMWVNVSSNKLQYWNIFRSNYDRFMAEQNHQDLSGLLELGYEIEDDTTVSVFVAMLYFYTYMSSHNKNLPETAKRDGLVVSRIAENKQAYRRIQSVGEVMQDIHKSYLNVIKVDNIQVITVNKIHAPKNWGKTDLRKTKATNHQILGPYIRKLVEIEEKTNAKNKEKGLIIDIVYHGIVIQVTEAANSLNKIELVVTLEQLIAILETLKLPQNLVPSCLETELPPIATTPNEKVEPKKELPSIVIQAKIVRTMKRAKTKLKLQQIYQEVSQEYLHVDKPMFTVALEKVIDRGFVAKVDAEEGHETYEYCP